MPGSFDNVSDDEQNKVHSHRPNEFNWTCNIRIIFVFFCSAMEITYRECALELKMQNEPFIVLVMCSA